MARSDSFINFSALTLSKTGITDYYFGSSPEPSTISHQLGLIAYLRVGHAAHLVLIELFKGLGGLLLADVEATGLNDAPDLVLGHTAIIIQVKAIEGLVQIEAGLALEALADGLSSNLNLEVHAPHVSELNLSV
jgi:hypothetical protein